MGKHTGTTVIGENIFQYYSINPEEMEKELQLHANELLEARQSKRGLAGIAVC